MMPKFAVLPIPSDPPFPPSEPMWERWAANLLCMWHLCERAGCRRARTCRGDPNFCMTRYHRLLPPAARDFLLGWSELKEDGQSDEDVWAELEVEREHLAAWQACVAHVSGLSRGRGR